MVRATGTLTLTFDTAEEYARGLTQVLEVAHYTVTRRTPERLQLTVQVAAETIVPPLAK